MLVHGSPDGYRQGCRSRGGCQHHRSPDYLTCLEAAIARRSDAHLAMLPGDQPIRRESPAPRVSAPEKERESRVHGTVWGYRRGCHADRACPHWAMGRITCAEARRRYFASYASRRLDGIGAAVLHGTSRGYLTGCRDRARCPGGEGGLTCPEARNRHKQDLARAAGVSARAHVDAAPAAARIAEWRLAGLSLRRIAAATGVGRTTIAAIAGDADGDGDRRRRIDPATFHKILAVPDVLV